MNISIKESDKMIKTWKDRKEELRQRNPTAALAVSECLSEYVKMIADGGTKYEREMVDGHGND